MATITGFDIQGRSSSNQYIKKFTMSYRATKHVGFRDYSEVCCDHVFLKTVKRRDLKKLHDVVEIYRNLAEVPKMIHSLSQEVEYGHPHGSLDENIIILNITIFLAPLSSYTSLLIKAASLIIFL